MAAQTIICLTSKKTKFIDCQRTMDCLAEFRAWLDEFVTQDKLPSHDWLIKRVAQALREESGKAKLMITGLLDLRVL